MIGAAITAVVAEHQGVRPVAVAADVPHTTARGWVRPFRRRAHQLVAAFSALVVEVAGVAPGLPPAGAVAEAVLAAMQAAFDVVRARAGPALPPLWGFVALVTGGRLLGSNRNPPSIVLGRRRLIAPVP